jgi:signal-transduction protein with cAMP-binding, CBS, and nucleotidyltransferase domain
VHSVGVRDDLGIMTEKDLIDAIATGNAQVLSTAAREHASWPVASLPQSAFVYQAIGRMQRLGTGHLAVVNEAGQVKGIVAARSILEGRKAQAILLGDRVMTAESADELALAADELPAVARGLLDSGMTATAISAVISDALHHLAVRAAALTEMRMQSEGRGPAPVPWALLMLGSAGRGESLLAPDQDNAIVYLGSSRHDPWFEMFARAFVDTLNEAGVPYCSGYVMASNPAWRRPLVDWNQQIAAWLDMQSVDCLHNINAFFDMKPIYGDARVADELHGNAVGMATSHRATLERMAEVLSGLRPPLTFFGRFELESGRLNLKTAILPLVTAARILALLVGSTAQSTVDRLREAAAGAWLSAEQAVRFSDIYDFLMSVVLAQQLLDLEHGIAPSTCIDVSQLDVERTRRLREALRQIDRLLKEFPTYCVSR